MTFLVTLVMQRVFLFFLLLTVLLNLTCLAVAAPLGGEQVLVLISKVKLADRGVTEEDPAVLNKHINDILLMGSKYNIPRVQLCEFLSLNLVQTTVKNLLDKPLATTTEQHHNLFKNIEACLPHPQLAVYARRLAFNILLFGGKARLLYLADARTKHRKYLMAHLSYARTFLYEGKLDPFKITLKKILKDYNTKGRNSFDLESLAWLYQSLAYVELNQGHISAYHSALKEIDRKVLSEDQVLIRELRIMSLHDLLIAQLSKSPVPSMKLPEFCSTSESDFMRYRELEICLATDYLVNKRADKSMILKYKEAWNNLNPLQIMDGYSSLYFFEKNDLLTIDQPMQDPHQYALNDPEQTMFKKIFNFVSDKKPTSQKLKKMAEFQGKASIPALMLKYGNFQNPKAN